MTLRPQLASRFTKGGKKASLLREVARSARGFENTLCHSEAKAEESQSCSQRMVCPLTLTLSPIWRGDKKPAFTLAEGATHVDMFHDIRKSAFTLAEVLVTLGIIGVVAAMTIPMLAKNYKFFVLQQQFKKAYAELSIAVQKTQMDLGEGVRCYYRASSSSGANGDPNGLRTDCVYFFSELARNFQTVKVCQGNALEEKCIPDDFRGGNDVYAETQGGDDKDAAQKKYSNQCGGFTSYRVKNTAVVTVANNTFTIIPYENGGGTAPIFIFDINAGKGPNKWGHDIHVFQFERLNKKESVFKISPSPRCRALDIGGYYTKDFVEYLYGRNAEL